MPARDKTKSGDKVEQLTRLLTQLERRIGTIERHIANQQIVNSQLEVNSVVNPVSKSENNVQ